MRFLADENFPANAVEAIRERGHDITWIQKVAPGSSDQEVLQLAQAEARIILTFDKDFGELAFRAKLPASSGIVLFRITLPSSEYVARIAVAALEGRSDWTGHFTVIEDNRIRLTQLPKAEE
jgi:predicted nuclease of predicted toxin-antitoxin system